MEKRIEKELNKYFKDVERDVLIRTFFDISRYYDKNLKILYKEKQKEENIVFDSYQRKILRDYYYYGNKRILKEAHVHSFPKIDIDKNTDVSNVCNTIVEKIESINGQKIIRSIYSRIGEINKINEEKVKARVWLKENTNDNKYGLVVINLNQNLINKNRNYEETIFSIIEKSYDLLENYRYCAIVIKNNIKIDGIDITWEILAKVAVYMENFKEYNGAFFPFKKDIKEKELLNFLNNNKNLIKGNYGEIINDYYSKISTGFVYSDLLISEDANQKILIMRKIELDEKEIACPSCLNKSSRGNSYPMMFLKSWECQNPNCPERSKSGRGKRFDYYGVLRYFKLVENNHNNIINKELYCDWRRDIFKESIDLYKMLFMYYVWSGEKILIINEHRKISKVYKGRKIIVNNNIASFSSCLRQYEELPIVVFLTQILKYKKENKKNNRIDKRIKILNEDSTSGIINIQKNEIKYVITSPPYYNAREYSQWPTFITYLIDMMLNAKSVFDVLHDEGIYMYNVGDIVDMDNIYVSSLMSRRRIMLGFYSWMIFNIVGFKICGDIIWDKGEVESKRNSTVNLNTGYVKYVNCYEHILIFKKTRNLNDCIDCIKKIKPVYKINSKGVNVLGHTAPYPERLVDIIGDYISDDKYLLDPFLGSGTTGIWAKKHNVNFVGFEIDKKYYILSKDRIIKEGRLNK